MFTLTFRFCFSPGASSVLLVHARWPAPELPPRNGVNGGRHRRTSIPAHRDECEVYWPRRRPLSVDELSPWHRHSRLGWRISWAREHRPYEKLVRQVISLPLAGDRAAPPCEHMS